MQIFDSYIDAGQHLPQDEREKYYTALVEYLAYGVEPQAEGAALAIMTAIRPSLDESRKKQINGRKGGKSKKSEKQNGKNQESKTPIFEKQNPDFPESKTAKNEKAKPQKSRKQNPNFSESKTPFFEKANSNSNSKSNLQEKEKDKKEKEDDTPYADIVGYLNGKLGTGYRPGCEETRRLIRARFKNGFTTQDFYTVIDKKCSDWLHDEKMCKYLRPQTLFGTKFESYLNEPASRDPPKPEVDFSIYEVGITEMSSEDFDKDFTGGGDYVPI